MTQKTDEAETWKGSPINEIYDGFGEYARQNQAPIVEECDDHTVLFELPLTEDENELPTPRNGDDKWDENHVRLPTNPSSKYSEIDEEGNKSKKLRWDLIRESLMEKEIKTIRDMEDAIKKYNTQLAESWNFSLLHSLFEDEFSEQDSEYFFEVVMPKLINLALRLPDLIPSSIPLLKKKMNHSISLSQEQAGCLLANAFFCTFPQRNVGRSNTDYPEINFNRLFSSSGSHTMEKLKCVLNYFRMICLKMPNGVLTYQRRYVDPIDFPNWSESKAKFSSIKLSISSERTIEDGNGMLQVDFANLYLGGGVLGWGCVQEEIRFVMNPELIVGMLFCESMKNEEAIVMTGCAQFNKYSGYSRSFKWKGSFIDETPRDVYRRKMIHVVAIDALSFHKPEQQFKEFSIKREANKAFAGFFHDPNDLTTPIPVSSGNWGCGVFRGNKQLKVLIQLLACCVNRRNLFYCTFGETELMDQIHEMFEFLIQNDFTVELLWRCLNAFRLNNLMGSPDTLYEFIYKEHRRIKICEELLEGIADSDVTDDELFNNAESRREPFEIEGKADDQEIEAVDEECEATDERPSKKPRIDDTSEEESEFTLQVITASDPESENFKNVIKSLGENALDSENLLVPNGMDDEELIEVRVEQPTSSIPLELPKPAKKITDFFKPKT